MQTEDIAVSARARHGWEAVDLGFSMARSWWKPLFGAWLVVVLPAALLLNLIFVERLWLASLLLWWLKPLFDRVALHVCSEALFGKVPSIRETVAALPSLLRSGVLRSLFLYRLTPLRSFSMPVLQLEGSRGASYRERTRLLIGRDAGVGMALLFVCVNFEIVLGMALMVFVWQLVPPEANVGFFEFYSADDGLAMQLGLNAVYVLMISLVEPFYVAGGFALYISRRMYLEGWDIDLSFRRMARRAGEARARSVAAALTLVAALLLSAGAQSDELDCSAAAPQDAAACIERVLEAEEFHQTREVTIWAPRWESEDPAEAGDLTGLLAQIGRFFAFLLEASVWIGLTLLAGVLGYLLVRRILDEPEAQRAVPDEAEVRFGLDVRPESLPDDVIAAARSCWEAGDAIAALSLLYRGSLVHLTRARGLRLPASATEGECMGIVQRELPGELAGDFAELTSSWQTCAYGRREPADERFARLCERWAVHLRVQPGASA